MQRVCLAPLLQPETSPDPAAYIRLLRRAFQTVLFLTGVRINEDPGPAPGPARMTATAHPRQELQQGDLFEEWGKENHE